VVAELVEEDVRAPLVVGGEGAVEVVDPSSAVSIVLTMM